MYRLIECITQEHDHWLLAVAAFVCVSGSGLTVLTMRRVLGATGTRKRVQLVLSSLITGATIWSTHFIAMLAYDPGTNHGYEPVITGLSLAVAVLGVLGAHAAFGYATGHKRFVIAGTVFGLTVSVMHFIGMSAFQIPGELVFHATPAVVAAVLGVAIGIASYHRILYPITRYCWLGGMVLMVLAICAMHFTAMSAIEIRLNSAITVPPLVLPKEMLGLIVSSVVTLVMFIGFSAISIETTLEREAVVKLEHSLLHDHLTGLPNRQHLTRRLQELDARLASDPDTNVAILTINLDLFKQINDIHGQTVGDCVLREIAARLTACICPEDGEYVARIGGDEFVAIKTNLSDPKDAFAFGERVYFNIIPTIANDICSVAPGASLGISTTFNDGSVAEELLRKAHLAMFRAKQEIDIHICQYDAQMDQQIRETLLLTNDLRSAIAENQFELVYQVQNRTNSREPIGCEALLRWHHPVRGTVSPVVFIPLAEDSGLIQEIGLWVLRTACFEAASWDNSWSIAVNVAPQQLNQPTFLEHLSDILLETQLPPERLELEVTEASVIHDQAFTLKVLKNINAMGVRIAMDDFGTGYSSLATLQLFPFDKIKIDRSFVTDLQNNRKRAAIVRSTISLGEAFGIPVLAEGVETEEELRFLDSEGCDFVQGYYFGKPMCVKEIRYMMTVQIKAAAS